MFGLLLYIILMTCQDWVIPSVNDVLICMCADTLPPGKLHLLVVQLTEHCRWKLYTMIMGTELYR
jgi:hypothetical protein